MRLKRADIATHSGHCQACGRLQKLPKGKLSKHGYTVARGYFAGICRGHAELPFEKSCELVKVFIAGAKNELANVERFIRDLLRPATSAKAWMHVSYKDPKGYGYVREWEQVDLMVRFVPYADGDGGSLRYTYTDREGKIRGESISEGYIGGLQRYEKKGVRDEQLLLDSVTKLNAIYAKWEEHEAVSLRRYIAWQTERVNNWQEQDLIPVVGQIKDDKQGFIPTPAAY